ncbi:hypothetical protein [Paraliomyxa miuraensis]|uniref:hypothetical protein n=1 Tax=Paraliomyxa miuraensis TaxID=376150 RepID=UPI0022520769|nr:hypothetical protein [Paraliomyxa miuraensis]MCX4243731.1 hypothetical protein [Paraliomyxa miuraensis]
MAEDGGSDPLPRLDGARLRAAQRWLRWAPLLLVTGFSLWLLWPMPLGRMPLSADHTVHLTRIWMYAEQLASGQLRGWDTTWFFGTPVGELYPVLGDLLIVAIRALSLGALSWPQAYALGITVVFTTQGWAMLRVGRALGLGPLPGLVAALLVLADVGAYREGGWIYTITYGVWPQALATALTWLSLAELCVACETDDSTVRRTRLATGALAMGAALLAHPMAMTTIALGGPLLVLVLGLRSRAALARTATVAALGAVLGVAMAAWWLWPMLEHRAWMASYGWMWLPLDRMAAMAGKGQWTQVMPTAVGMVVSVGLVLVAVLGSRPARFMAALALLQWLLASRDVLWALRLDRLSEGFTHLQYQRFLIAAKPGLLLAAGAGLALLTRGAWEAWRRLPRRWARPTAAAPLVVMLGLCAWMFVEQRAAMREHQVGQIQRVRLPDQPEFDDDYAALIEWMRERAVADAEAGTPPYRATVVASRNLHWFMDAPALTGMRLYKQGFTPGDNFVHKPEASTDHLLDRLRVRYVITTDRRRQRGAVEVASFGRIRVLEREGWAEQPIAWLEGPGALSVLEEDVDGGVVRVRVSGAGEGTRVTFAVAGFPRWTLEQGGQEIAWEEAPVLGDGPGVTPQERRSGALRGGKARGDDGTEPTLIAADVGDGELVLRHHPRRASDVLAGVLSLSALALGGVLLWRPRRWTIPTERLDALVSRISRWVRPWLLGGLVLVLALAAGLRERSGAAAERGQAFGWANDGRARLGRHARAGLLKTDMLIRPAVLVDPRRNGTAELVFPGVTLGGALTGWIALDDDATMMKARGNHRVHIEAIGADGVHTSLGTIRLPHRPGRRMLELDASALSGQRVDLLVTVESDGESPPALGFDLDLDLEHGGEGSTVEGGPS